MITIHKSKFIHHLFFLCMEPVNHSARTKDGWRFESFGHVLCVCHDDTHSFDFIRSTASVERLLSLCWCCSWQRSAAFTARTASLKTPFQRDKQSLRCRVAKGPPHSSTPTRSNGVWRRISLTQRGMFLDSLNMRYRLIRKTHTCYRTRRIKKILSSPCSPSEQMAYVPTHTTKCRTQSWGFWTNENRLDWLTCLALDWFTGDATNLKTKRKRSSNSCCTLVFWAQTLRFSLLRLPFSFYHPWSTSTELDTNLSL